MSATSPTCKSAKISRKCCVSCSIPISASTHSKTARLTVLNFDANAAGHYGDIRSILEKQGNIIGPYNLMIAGHARSQGLTLVTNNLREFEQVDGLRVENWV
ncbi:PIN domain-containing protein [Thalassospira alkalitolerans]|uniref:PIN domain-containing protein n=1 Tax=Thalassospira alkalitolerans TaxID=1293890 RepID=UPI003AA81237